MSKTRDNYNVTGNSVEELRLSLNFLLQRMADRMDKIEGIRGAPSIEATLTMNANIIENVGGGELMDDAARLDDLSGFVARDADETIDGAWEFTQATTFDSDVIIGGDADVTGNISTNGNVYVYDSNGVLIHSME